MKQKQVSSILVAIYLFIGGLFCSLMLGMTGCIKADTFPDEPHIVDVQVNQSVLGNNLQSFQIIISFEDGNGDLGRTDEDPNANVFAVDSREQECEDLGLLCQFINPGYAMPFVELQGSEDDVKGEIIIDYAGTCCIYFPPTGDAAIPYCTPNGSYPEIDSMYFDIQIRDRANNFSNIVRSPLIQLMCTE